MAYKSQIQKFGLAIDFETTGFSLTTDVVQGTSITHYAKNHQGISFGALIFNVETFEIVDRLYCEMKFKKDKYQWSVEAEKIHGLSQEHLEGNGLELEEAAVLLAELIFKYNGADQNLLILGHRPYFDIAFLNQMMASVNFELKYDPIKLDSAAFALTFFGVTKSDELFDFVGLPPRKEHNSLEDIEYTLKSIRTIRHYFIKGLEAES